MTVVWRGGRRFKPQKKAETKEKRQNGASEDAVMIIDSDSDEPPTKAQAAKKFEDKPEFEDVDDQQSYPEIIQTLDLTLGTSVLHVAVIPMSVSGDHFPAGTALADKMVFAVSCVTTDVYLITLPLTPPSPNSTAREELRSGLLAGQAGSGAWGESLVLLGGQRKHSDALAINLVKAKYPDRKSESPRAVVASCSRQASGTLVLWDVPLDTKPKAGQPIEPFQTEFLPHPLTNILFNPGFTTQLLTVSAYHAVRVYDYAVSSLPPDPEASGPFPAQGSWLLSLYPPFVRLTASRKPILDASWIANGRAVFALMADGMWGIWDVDGVRPSSLASEAAMSNKLTAGVTGAAITAFSISGYVEGTSSLRSVATQQKENHTGEFAPMTPHTRRQAAATLSSANTIDRLAAVRGGIRIVLLPPKGQAAQDESLVLWVGGLEHVCVIPAVTKFWDSQRRKADGRDNGSFGLFNSVQPTTMIKLLDLATGLLGERCCGVCLEIDANKASRTYNEDEMGLPVDVVVQGESRIVIVRQGEDGHGKKIGASADSRRRRLFSKGARSNAIIVHGKPDRAVSLSFDLSTAKPGTLRRKSVQVGQEATGPQHAGADDTAHVDSRPRIGFDFMNSINAAADVSTDFTSRDVEAEMLDIMEIDQALENLEGSRGTGRKNVFFEED